VPDLRLRHALGRIAPAALAVLVTTCSSPINPGPVVEVTIASVTPSTGSPTGGTEVTIRGSGFAVGAAITIGGLAAVDVNVRGSDLITAKTPASPVSGAVDIVATVNGRTATLAGGFRYEVVSGSAPTIKSIVAQGTRPRQPPLFADYGETIRLTAVVEDVDTPAAQLQYDWHACGGTVTGSGAQVDWKAPTGVSSPTCTIELIVDDGSRIATGSVVVRLHNSLEEIGTLVHNFLNDFADSTVPADIAVRNFSNSCPGKADELKDVERNRRDYIHISHTYGGSTITVAFGGMCKTKTADACAITPVEWRSTYIPTGQLEVATGISTISVVYRDSRWWLCDSSADGASTLGFWFMR